MQSSFVSNLSISCPCIYYCEKKWAPEYWCTLGLELLYFQIARLDNFVGQTSLKLVHSQNGNAVNCSLLVKVLASLQRDGFIFI